MDRWQQLQELFNEAVDLPRAERAAFLDKACGDDETLRREAKSLIMADEQSAEKIQHVIQEAAQQCTLDDAASAVGRRIGSFSRDSYCSRAANSPAYENLCTPLLEEP